MNYWLKRSYKNEVRPFLLMTNDFIYNVSITIFTQLVVESSNVEFILSSVIFISIICVFILYKCYAVIECNNM